jgi:hypothetical protein
MSSLALMVATSFLTSSILSLAVPLGVLIVVAFWYVMLWIRGVGER